MKNLSQRFWSEWKKVNIEFGFSPMQMPPQWVIFVWQTLTNVYMPKKAIKINLSQLGKGDRNRVGQDLKAYLSNVQSVSTDESELKGKAKQKSVAK